MLDALPPRRMEYVGLRESSGRYAAGAVRSERYQPSFDAAAMDGWAACGTTEGVYRVVGESRAGARYDQDLRRGEAVSISTGAPMPTGAVRVVRHEDAIDRGALVKLPALVAGRRDIRVRGSDFKAGDVLLPDGQRVGPLDVARLAAAGVAELHVWDRPRVVILPTGDEIACTTTEVSRDEIHDALSLALELRAAEAGALAACSAPVPDAPNSLETAIRVRSNDIVVIIGGASRGRHDHSRHALSSLGLKIIVPNVLIRPGKPFWFGRLVDGRLIVGLPGNPVAALACAELFLLPLIRAWQGDQTTGAEFNVVCSTLPSHEGVLERLVFAKMSIDQSGFVDPAPLGGADSAALAPLLGADMLLRATASWTKGILLRS